MTEKESLHLSSFFMINRMKSENLKTKNLKFENTDKAVIVTIVAGCGWQRETIQSFSTLHPTTAVTGAGTVLICLKS